MACYGLWDGNLSAHKGKYPQVLWRWSPSSTFHIEQPICYFALSALDVSFHGLLVQGGVYGALHCHSFMSNKNCCCLLEMHFH